MKKQIKAVFLLAAAVSLFAGSALMAMANGKESIAYLSRQNNMGETAGQAPREVITEIHHKHAGNTGEMGGCYSIPVAHQHQGNEQTGGPCYRTEVKHVHEGNENVQGGCYTKPEYHQHQGDEQQGGACYEAVCHEHSPECYQTKTCLVNHTLTGPVLETWTDTCFNHQETLFGRAAGIDSHGDCGAEDEERFFRYCLSCGMVVPTTHSYQELVCQMDEGTVTGYQLSCNKDETTVERYGAECGLQESEREGYALSCLKTVDGYGLGCGFGENELLGRIILTNETAGQSEKAVLKACLEDFTGGKLKMKEPAFEWRDEKGQLLGNGEKVAVSENGTYSVHLKLENKDVDEAGLKSSILVDNILAQPSATATPSATSTPGATASPGATAAPEAAETSDPAGTSEATTVPDSEDAGQGDSGQEEETRQSPTPQKTMAPQSREDLDGTDGGAYGSGSAGETAKGKAKAWERPGTSPEVVPTKAPLVKVSGQVKARENEAQEENTYEAAEKKKSAGLFALPGVRVITVTGSALLLIAGSLLLLFYLRNSVRVFNDNGEGKMIYLGRCRVKREEENYEITITEEMEEKTITNRYCIRPGIFLVGKKEGQELAVHQGTKAVSVYLSREIIVVI